MDVRRFLLELALQRESSTFESLALASGLSARDCALAARTGRLGDVIRGVAEQRGRGRDASGTHCLPGAVALARIRAREVSVW